MGRINRKESMTFFHSMPFDSMCQFQDISVLHPSLFSSSFLTCILSPIFLHFHAIFFSLFFLLCPTDKGLVTRSLFSPSQILNPPHIPCFLTCTHPIQVPPSHLLHSVPVINLDLLAFFVAGNATYKSLRRSVRPSVRPTLLLFLRF